MLHYTMSYHIILCNIILHYNVSCSFLLDFETQRTIVSKSCPLHKPGPGIPTSSTLYQLPVLSFITLYHFIFELLLLVYVLFLFNSFHEANRNKGRRNPKNRTAPPFSLRLYPVVFILIVCFVFAFLSFSFETQQQTNIKSGPS